MAAWIPEDETGTNPLKLSHPRHSSDILDSLNQLRKFSNLCDGNIVLADGCVQVQCNILAAASPYFRALFTFDAQKSTSDADPLRTIHSCKLEDLSCTVFEKILDFIYTSDLVLCEENIQEMLQAADLLLMEDVKSMCCDYLEQCITVSNCIGILDFSERFCCPRVKHFTSAFIDENFTEVSFTEEFLQLSVEKLTSLLQRNSLTILTENIIFECVRRWVVHLPDQREEKLPGLLRDCVNVALLEERYIQEHIIPDPLIRKLHLEAELQSMRQSRGEEPAQQRGYCNMVVVTGGEGPCENDNRIVEIKNSTKCMAMNKKNKQQSSCAWLELSDMKTSRVGHGMVEAGGYLFAIGGRDNNGRILNSGEKFNPLENKWADIPPMNHARVGFGLVAIDDKIYAIGGSNDMSDPITSMEEYDIYADRWKSLPDMNLKRAWSAYAVCNKKIYVIGGGIMGKLYEAVECYDPSSLTWVSVSPMKERRFDARAVGMNGVIYVFGGLRRLECPSAMQGNSGMKFCSTEIFHAEHKVWSMGARDLGMCTMRDSTHIDTALLCGDEILLIGSLDMGGQYHCIRAFNPTINMWRCVAQNHPPYQKGMQAAVLRMPRALVYQLMWAQKKITFTMMSSLLPSTAAAADTDAVPKQEDE